MDPSLGAIDATEEGSRSAPEYSTTQKVVLAIIPMISGCLSVLGSSIILFIIFKDRKRKLAHVYHRLLLGMSMMDVVFSTTMGLSVVMVPNNDPDAWGAQGNMATCRAQGFIGVMGYTVFLYNMCLSIYYVLVIRYGMREVDIVKYHLERGVHFVCIAYPLSLASMALAKNLYWPGRKLAGWCTIGWPKCLDDAPDSDCRISGNEAEHEPSGLAVRWATLLCLCLVLVVVIVCMILIYSSVRHQERSMYSRYGAGRMRGLREEAMARTRETAQQAVLYVVAMFLCIIFAAGIYVEGMSTTSYFTFAALMKLFSPLQGLWNCLIYIRPRFIALRGRLRGESMFTVLQAVLAGDRRQNARLNLERRRSSATLRYQSGTHLGKNGGSCDVSVNHSERRNRQQDHFAPELGIRIIHESDSLSRLDEVENEEGEAISMDATAKKTVTTQESGLDEVDNEEGKSTTSRDATAKQASTTHESRLDEDDDEEGKATSRGTRAKLAVLTLESLLDEVDSEEGEAANVDATATKKTASTQGSMMGP